MLGRFKLCLAMAVLGVCGASWTIARADTFHQAGGTLTTSARTGSGSISTSVMELTDDGTGVGGFIDHHMAIAGKTKSASKYTLTNDNSAASLRIDVSHTATPRQKSLTNSAGEYEFTLTSSARFSLSGAYTASLTGTMAQRAALYDISDPTNATEVFFEEGARTTSGSLLLGPTDDEADLMDAGDVPTTVRGDVMGVLQPGTYRFSYLVSMIWKTDEYALKAVGLAKGDLPTLDPVVIPPERNANATGYMSLEVSVVPAPPAVWAGVALLGTLGALSAAKRFRVAPEMI